MTTAKATIEELIRRQEAGDHTVLDDLVAVDFVNHAAGPQGREGLRLILQTIDRDLGPVRSQQHHLVADGDVVVQHVTVRGTHRGSTMPLLAGLPATGAPAAWTFVHIWRVADGMIVEHWACRDDMALVEQLRAGMMRTLHVGIRVADLDRSLDFYAALGYEVVGRVPETPLGELAMLKLPGDEFVTLELVHDPQHRPADDSPLSHLVVKVDSMDEVVAQLRSAGIDCDEPTSQDGSSEFLTAMLADPDRNRIELVQWPRGHADGMSSADFSDGSATRIAD